MNELIRRMPWSDGEAPEELLGREWLVTNGLGGYASGTVGGVTTRRYHGLLIAALSVPAGRTVMLNHLTEAIRPGGERWIALGGEERSPEELLLPGAAVLEEFRLELGLPVWRYRIGEQRVEKRVLMIHIQNTVHVRYRLLEGRTPLELRLCPSIHFRPHDAAVGSPLPQDYRVHADGDRYQIGDDDRFSLRLRLLGECARFSLSGGSSREVFYRREAQRGYPSRGHLWSPGELYAQLGPGHDAVLIASTEPWSTVDVLSPDEAAAAEHHRRRSLLRRAGPAAADEVGAELVLAADQFVVSPLSRDADAVRARADGEDVRTVIAGYHWFTDWGRDSMISLEGLTLTTNRRREAGWILRTFANHVRDGLIPNLFPEGERDGLYHTADASLWFFEAVARYMANGGHRTVFESILPRLEAIVRSHLEGTRFGIAVDPEDGLLRQGAPGYQLTWMDAKVEDWVVTPRRGKAVEINALWYNALRLLESWLRAEGRFDDAGDLAAHAERAGASFNRRFWYAEGDYLYDVIDGEGGDDASLRPNQLLAISLSHPVLDPERWQPVVDTVERTLLTPVGLRSLAPGHPDYQSRYFGDLRSRDAAYHQGTVWAWLIGPFVDAWLRIHPSERTAGRRFLEGLVDHLHEACFGSISEVFDAEAPFTARGCIAQAWSVAEVLRCWTITAPEE